MTAQPLRKSQERSVQKYPSPLSPDSRNRQLPTESAAISALQFQRQSLTLRLEDGQGGRSDGSVGGREEESETVSAGDIDVRLTLEHLRARLLIIRR